MRTSINLMTNRMMDRFNIGQKENIRTDFVAPLLSGIALVVI